MKRKQCEKCRKLLAPNRKIPNILYTYIGNDQMEIEVFLCHKCYMKSLFYNESDMKRLHDMLSGGKND